MGLIRAYLRAETRHVKETEQQMKQRSGRAMGGQSAYGENDETLEDQKEQDQEREQDQYAVQSYAQDQAEAHAFGEGLFFGEDQMDGPLTEDLENNSMDGFGGMNVDDTMSSEEDNSMDNDMEDDMSM